MKTEARLPRRTLDDIGRSCKVSAMTVSRALRNRGPIKDSTRKRILAAAERAGYFQGLKAGRPSAPPQSARAFEVVLGNLGRRIPSFYLELITAIEQHLAQTSHDCLIRTCNGEYDQFLTLCAALKRSSAAGTMLVGDFRAEHLKALLDTVPNALLVDNPGDPALESGYESIGFDNAEAARIAVRHLLSIGRKKILLIRGPASHYFARGTEEGYREALAHAGVPLRDDMIMEADFTADGAYAALAAALSRRLVFDAVYTNDEMAVGVYRALHKHRLVIPDNVAVCGCDGLPIGQQLFPALTTVFLDYKEMGRMSVDRLLQSKGRNAVPCRIKLVPRLEKRGSTDAQPSIAANGRR